MAQAKVFNFAYGSNMLLSRIRERVSSARSLGTAVLKGHQLRWHKASKDGSGKCDVIRSDSVDATVHGVLYEIAQHQKVELDAAEGLGNGYDEKQARRACCRVCCQRATY